MKESTIIGTIPAASELHKVPGFDPMKHLRRTVNAQGESVMGLELRYQRLWFRMACPKGRMLLNPLRITDQLAIFEAKVFFHRDDTAPASSFTANKTARETPDYIRAAQDEALREALDNAGFGIQLCDVPQAPSDEAPALVIPMREKEPVQEKQIPVSQPAAQEIEPVESPPAQDATDDAPTEEAPQETASPDPSQQSVLTVLDFPAQAEAVSQEPTETAAPGAPSYTDETPVEEILQVMTMEDAKAFIVTRGPNVGLTMDKVAERRPSSLHFFLTPYCECGNIQKAAATLLLQDLEQKKAG